MNPVDRRQQRTINALCFLGLFEVFDREFRMAQSPQQAQAAIDSVKEAAKQKGKELAKKHHPDLGGDIEKMKEVNEAISEIKMIQLVPLQPPPRPQPVMRQQVIIINFNNSSVNVNGDIFTSTSGTGMGGWPF